MKPIIACLLLMACGEREAPLPERLVEPYYKALSLCTFKARNVEVKVGFTGKEDTLAACRIYKNKVTGQIVRREIIFNTDYYNVATSEALTRTMYHELGHCWIGLKDLYNEEDALKLMYWQDQPIEDYEEQFRRACNDY